MSYSSYPTPPAYPGGPAGPNTPQRLRGRTPLRLAIIFFVVAVALFVVGGVVLAKKSLGKVNDFQRVSISAGTGSINLDKGSYVAYYEADGADTANGVPIVPVRLTAPSGATKILTTLYGGRSDNKIKSLTYSYDKHDGAALYQFTVTESGTYKVETESTPRTAPNADLAFGDSIAGGTVAGALLIVLGVLVLIAAIVLLIVGLVKRSRHKSQLAVAGGYGGYGGYGAGYGGGYGGPPGTYPPPGGGYGQQGQSPQGGYGQQGQSSQGPSLSKE